MKIMVVWKTVPGNYKERLIETMRREFLDHVLFWNARDLERKLADFQAYYNEPATTRHWRATRR